MCLGKPLHIWDTSRECCQYPAHTFQGMYSSLSQESVCEARHKQKHPHDPMWPVRFVCLQPADVPVCHFKDEDLGEVALHSLFEDMVCGRLDCRTVPVLGLAIVHDGVAQGPHATHRPPKGFRDDRFPLHLRLRKVGVDDHGIIGKETHHRFQILGLNSSKCVCDEIM